MGGKVFGQGSHTGTVGRCPGGAPANILVKS